MPTEGEGSWYVLDAEPDSELAILTVECAKHQHAEVVRDVLRRALESGRFVSIIRNSGVTCAVIFDDVLGDDVDVLGSEVDRKWTALRLQDQRAGVLAALYGDGLSTGFRVKAISGSRSEYLLFPTDEVKAAAVGLVRLGHAIRPAERVSLAPPAKIPCGAGYDRYVGAWSLLRRESPIGTVIEEYPEGEGPFRIQTWCGLFAEVSVPNDKADLGSQRSCAGYHSVLQQGDPLSVRHRTIDFRPPDGHVLCTEVSFEGRMMTEVSKPRGQYREEYREVWAKLSDEETPTVALELQEETSPTGEVSKEGQRAGCWLFCGSRFVRVVGLPRGTGLIGSTACRSVVQLMQVCGTQAVAAELTGQFEALRGFSTTAGSLRIEQEAWQQNKEHRLFLDPQDPVAGGVITRDEDSLAHTLPNGVVQRWSIREYNFDVFANTIPAPKDTTKVDERADGKSDSPSNKKSKKEKDKRKRSSSSSRSSEGSKRKKRRGSSSSRSRSNDKKKKKSRKKGGKTKGSSRSSSRSQSKDKKGTKKSRRRKSSSSRSRSGKGKKKKDKDKKKKDRRRRSSTSRSRSVRRDAIVPLKGREPIFAPPPPPMTPAPANLVGLGANPRGGGQRIAGGSGQILDPAYMPGLQIGGLAGMNAGAIGDAVSNYCAAHNVDIHAQSVLRKLPQTLQQMVINEGPVGGTNPSAALMSRIRKVEATATGFGQGMTPQPQAFGPRPAANSNDIVAMFVQQNSIDHASETALRALPLEKQYLVIQEGMVQGCKNPSAVLMGRIRKAQIGQPVGQGLSVTGIAGRGMPGISMPMPGVRPIGPTGVFQKPPGTIQM